HVSEREIVKRTGIQTRRWVGKGESASTLALEAAQKALQAAGLSARSLDMILVSTTSPDMVFPSTACLVQKGLSAGPVPAFDLNASCSGFLYALSVGDQYIRNGSAERILIVSAEVKSPFIDPTDPATAILFGDGAGGVILARGERGIRSIRIYADGSRHGLIFLPAGSSRRPTSSESLREGLHYMKMEGKPLFRAAVKKMEGALEAILEEEGLSSSEIDFFVFHQANLRILEALFKKKKIPFEKTETTISKYGNTSSSSLPIALAEAIQEKRIRKGDRVILCAFGGGLTWGAALIEW
ncbi:MAG TPA: beta-ketoacyl-ACP synthase III, partial [Candidatus Manganitrophaceae bacterium]